MANNINVKTTEHVDALSLGTKYYETKIHDPQQDIDARGLALSKEESIERAWADYAEQLREKN